MMGQYVVPDSSLLNEEQEMDDNNSQFDMGLDFMGSIGKKK